MPLNCLCERVVDCFGEVHILVVFDEVGDIYERIETLQLLYTVGIEYLNRRHNYLR